MFHRLAFGALKVVDRTFFNKDPLECARTLVGCELVWGDTGGIIVETEAYAESGDEACHAFLRRLMRAFITDKPAGSLYIYLNYGVHWLLNFLTKGPAANGFVLIRALEPTRGWSIMEQRRGLKLGSNLCAGPGKLTQALGIDGTWNGKDFFSLSRVAIHAPETAPPIEIDRRIGITKAADFEWRFLMAGSRYVSAPRTKTRPRAD